MDGKSEWRRRARRERAATRLDHEHWCEMLARFLRSRPDNGCTVAYRALPDEVNLDGLLARHDVGRLALTRTPDSGMQLTVHPAGAPAERHRYGFEQPQAGAPEVPDHEIAVVLVPGLAFDRNGGRLGRGRGYYDRFLGRLPNDTALVGITGDYVVTSLPVDEHDVAMTHLARSSGVVPVPLRDADFPAG